MSQPTPYAPLTTFVTYQAQQAWFPGPQFDVEFNNIKTTLSQILANLKLIQRDDGAVQNGVVGFNALDATLSAAFAGATTLPVPNANDLAWKTPVRAATTGSNITLLGAQTIDGVALAVGDRILVKDQAVQSQNGIYVVATTAWTRATDAQNNTQLVQGTGVLVVQGTANALTTWILTAANPITIGTSNLTWGFKP